MIEAYTIYLQEKNSPQNTSRNYLKVAALFEKFLSENSVTANYEIVNARHVELFKMNLINHQPAYSNATINTYLKFLKAYTSFLTAHNKCEVLPKELFKRTENRDIKDENEGALRWLTDVEESLLNDLFTKKPTLWKQEWIMARNKAIYYVGLYAGLRISEIINLDMNDVNGQFIRVVKDGVVHRTIPVKKELKFILKNYKELRNERLEMTENNSDAFFISQKGGRITTNTVFKMYEKLSKLSHLSFLTSHTLRHTCAERLLKSGVDLVKVAEFMGHSTIEFTALYLKSNRN